MVQKLETYYTVLKITYTDSHFILCKANKVAVDVKDLVRSDIDEKPISGGDITLNLGISVTKFDVS